jgi:hypothetical protein
MCPRVEKTVLSLLYMGPTCHFHIPPSLSRERLRRKTIDTAAASAVHHPLQPRPAEPPSPSSLARAWRLGAEAPPPRTRDFGFRFPEANFPLRRSTQHSRPLSDLLSVGVGRRREVRPPIPFPSCGAESNPQTLMYAIYIWI